MPIFDVLVDVAGEHGACVVYSRPRQAVEGELDRGPGLMKGLLPTTASASTSSALQSTHAERFRARFGGEEALTVAALVG